ncbi:NAD(P)/FAD-dependent oxidoreductase [Micromonospora harpali]|uniref:Flavin-containing monooxygenase n=1 Tax=Micromonospora harpali TaxID=1490225 RepID=A0ABW1HRA4_9ACTN
MTVRHVDVVIVGAGLSGIGAAYRLQTRRPGTSFLVLEARDTLGGTWDLFRYPGVRSDSDMFTLGYPFRPWTGERSIADGAGVLDYIRRTAVDAGLDRHVRLHHRVVRASWSSAHARWTVEAEVGPQRQPASWSCRFLYLCSGYFSYTGGHEIDLPGRETFRGRVVHPQDWPEDLDHADRRIAVIGSGATAITLVPALAERAAHVTMVQRSPTYVVAQPTRDRMVAALRAVLPAAAVHRTARVKNVAVTTLAYHLMRRWPARAAALLRAGVARELAGALPLDPHFRPRYAPWDERLCLSADGDFFRAIRQRRATVVTGEVAALVPDGLRMASGETVPADIVVTATGLRMVAVGEIALDVDGTPVDPGRTLMYKGMMLSGVPNLAWCVGYANASWTLRADLTSQYVCRLLAHLDRRGLAWAAPHVDGRAEAVRPLVGLTSGYVRRAAASLPKQGERPPWRVRRNYPSDLVALRYGRIADGAMRFGVRGRPVRPRSGEESLV